MGSRTRATRQSAHTVAAARYVSPHRGQVAVLTPAPVEPRDRWLSSRPGAGPSRCRFLEPRSLRRPPAQDVAAEERPGALQLVDHGVGSAPAVALAVVDVELDGAPEGPEPVGDGL